MGEPGRSRSGDARSDGEAARRTPPRRVVSAAEIRAKLRALEAAAEAKRREQAELALRNWQPLSDRYPERLMPIAGAEIYWPDIPEVQAVRQRYERFCDVREQALAGYGYNTARAYWGDLQDWFEWAEARGKDVLDLSEQDVKQYCALLRRRKYSESTIRRRVTAHRSLLRRGGTARAGYDQAPLTSPRVVTTRHVANRVSE